MLISRYTPAPTPDISLTAFVRASAATFGNRTALVDGPSGRSYTFRQLLDLSASIANALVTRGIVPGDRVAFIVPNIPESALAYHGVVGCGAVAMMLNPLSTADELGKYFKIGSPKLAFTVPLFVDAIRAADPTLELIVIGEPSFTALLGGSTVPPAIEIDPDAVAVMPYSSGTTGFPKGVMLTSRNIVSQVNALEAVSDSKIIVPDAALIAILPFFHIYGIMAFLTYGLARGAKIVCMPRFDVTEYVRLVQTYEVPILHVVPPILLALAKFPGELSLPHTQYALAGAAPLSAELAAEFTQRTGVMVYQVYGMTEVSGATHLASITPEKNKPGSIGGLIGGAECRIVDDNGADTERGELWVRGPFIMKGYFENPEATAQTIDSEGWLHTGDVGYVDPDGDFWVVDRVKELIKYKGMQVAPAELEAVLLQHPLVADCAVYPSPDEQAGEIPKAAVVLKPGASISAEELMQFVAGRVSPQKRVRAVRFVTAIPKSASGKILRRVLVAEDSV